MILSKEISIGSIRGVPVKIHSSFFLLLFIQLIAGLKISKESPLYLLFALILYGPIFLITIIIHELGHVLMTRKLGGTVDSIVLWPLGGFAICGPTKQAGVIGDLQVAMAGPLMHFPQMFMWFILYAIFSGGNFEYFQPELYLDIMSDGFWNFLGELCSMAFYINLFIFAVNFFIPAYPLDGGRCMVATLILLGMTVQHTAKITAFTGMFVAVILLILGLVSFFVEANANGFFIALVAVYIYFAGKHLYDMVNEGREKEHPLFNRQCYDDRELTIEQAVNEELKGNEGEGEEEETKR